MAIKRKAVSVSVSRTVQLRQYHPATVTVSESAEVPPGMDAKDVKLELYKSATASVTKFLKNEVREHGDDD